MKVRKLFTSPQFPYHRVLQTMDGRFFAFPIAFHRVTEAELDPMPGYQAKGRNAEEAPDYIYRMYGLEKAE